MYRKISAFIRKARDKAADLLDDFLDFLWRMPPVFLIVVISAATAFLITLLVEELVAIVKKSLGGG